MFSATSLLIVCLAVCSVVFSSPVPDAVPVPRAPRTDSEAVLPSMLKQKLAAEENCLNDVERWVNQTAAAVKRGAKELGRPFFFLSMGIQAVYCVSGTLDHVALLTRRLDGPPHGYYVSCDTQAYIKSSENPAKRILVVSVKVRETTDPVSDCVNPLPLHEYMMMMQPMDKPPEAQAQ